MARGEKILTGYADLGELSDVPAEPRVEPGVGWHRAR